MSEHRSGKAGEYVGMDFRVPRTPGFEDFYDLFKEQFPDSKVKAIDYSDTNPDGSRRPLIVGALVRAEEQETIRERFSQYEPQVRVSER